MMQYISNYILKYMVGIKMVAGVPRKGGVTQGAGPQMVSRKKTLPIPGTFSVGPNSDGVL